MKYSLLFNHGNSSMNEFSSIKFSTLNKVHKTKQNIRVQRYESDRINKNIYLGLLSILIKKTWNHEFSGLRHKCKIVWSQSKEYNKYFFNWWLKWLKTVINWAINKIYVYIYQYIAFDINCVCNNFTSNL